jgi:hypothetical protein
VIWGSYFDEMAKIAVSKFTRFLRTAPQDKVREAVNRYMGSMQSTRQKSVVLDKGLRAVRGGDLDDEARESLLKGLRFRAKSQHIQRPGTRYRRGDPEFGRTIKERAKSPTVRLAHGGNHDELMQMVRHGPSAHLDKSVLDATGRRTRGGAYFFNKGELSYRPDNTRYYAERAARDRGSAPAVLEMDFPRDLISTINKADEIGVPRNLWRHARNIKVTKTPKKLVK